MALNMDYKCTICERNIQRNKQAITTLESVKHHIILLLETRWEQRRCTRGSIGLGSMPLKFAVWSHYINTWVHVDEICKITAHSKRHGVHAKRQYTPWLLRCGVCVNKASDRLSPDLPTGHLRSQAISCWPWTGAEPPCICTHALT